MIGQYLPNNNETATVAFRQKFCQLNSLLLFHVLQGHIWDQGTESTNLLRARERMAAASACLVPTTSVWPRRSTASMRTHTGPDLPVGLLPCRSLICSTFPA
jgi:hypothetical protein